MLLNCDDKFLNSKVYFFFKYIFCHGVIPSKLSISHIIPIIKDKKKPNNSLNNLRPISISNTLAQIFERILLQKIPQLHNTHQNQFGYKRKISCTHALFAFKETIIKYIEEKKTCFAVSLDAVKAFDKVWREALWFKLKNMNIKLNLIILLKLYYDKLASKVKLGNFLSALFKLIRGLKQGDVLSGALFNTFIDDLIRECCESNLGATFFEIIVCIFGFCDDICLLSERKYELQSLITICENYGKRWAIEFNIPKCNFIVFGSNKLNNSIFLLNNLPLTYTDNFKYLGLEFKFDLNMSDFFLNKFSSVKNSYFSLNSYGFKPGGVNPFLQSYVYKTFCISRLLYGFEIMFVNKKTLKYLNIQQNNIVRYMTGLSKNSHISGVLKILKLFNIEELYYYMKLIFIKNLKNNIICKKIFDRIRVAKYNSKDSTKSFIKDFRKVCEMLEFDEDYVIDNIVAVIVSFKQRCREYDLDLEHELIKTSLENNHDYIMIMQLNLVTYAG